MTGRWATVLKAGLAVAIVGYVVAWVELDAMLAAFQQAHWPYVFAAALLIPLNLALEAGVWRQLVRQIAPATRWRTCGEAVLCGHAMGLLTPAQVGELAGRALYIPAGDRWALSAAAFTERLAMVALGGVVGVPVFIWFLIYSPPSPVGVAAAGAVYATVVTGLLVLGFTFPGRALQLLRRWRRVAQAFGFLRSVRGRVRLSVFTYTAARYAVFTLQFLLVLWAFVPDAAVQLALVGIVLVFLTKFLLPSITLGDLGIREGAAVYFFGWLGLAHAAALNASLVIFGLTVLVPAILGVPYVLRLRLHRKERSTSTTPSVSSSSPPPDA